MPSWSRFLPRRPTEAQLDSELRYHIERLTEEKIAAGLAPAEARREALLEFGGAELLKEELRDVHRFATVENTLANIRSGFRLMRKSPSFSAAVILTLALGIGANSAVFSAISAILLQPLPFPQGDELMLLHQYDRKAKSPNSFVAPVRLEDWNRLSSTFQAISGWYTQDASETSGALPEKVRTAYVAHRFLRVWGIPPLLGRDFSPEEEHFGGPTAVLISERFWRRRFQADTKAVGKQLRLEKSSYTIVGVMPGTFLFPDHDVDAWSPSPADAPFPRARELTWFTALGRLKPGITLAQARADLSNVQAELGREFPKTDGKLGVEIQPLKENTIGGARRGLWVLFGSVSLLLLIACTNIAALLLARTTEREREISVRFSLGASRASVIAQLLTECFVLAVTGAALGLFVADAGVKALRNLARTLPRVEEITLDWRILVYVLVCTAISTLLCGLFPALRVTRRGIASELAHMSRTQVSARNPLQWLLAGVQIALAVSLLVGAGLLLRSFQELGRVSPGFETSHILTLRISGNWAETSDYKKFTKRIDQELDRLRAVPGVRAAATSLFLPGISGDFQTEVKISEGRAETEGKIIADSRVVSDGYFEAMQIPILVGEGCRESLASQAVVNRSFADKYVSGFLVVGHHLQQLSNPWANAPSEIRGVVADAREEGLSREPVPTIYWCASAPNPSPWLLIRTQSDPMSMAGTLRRIVHQIEPARSVFDISPLEQHLSDSLGETRLRTFLLTLFAFTAISLACIGLYGTLSYFVTLRRREIGLRLALGAVSRRILGQFLRQGLGVSLLGCAAGLCLAAAFSRGLTSLLYGVSRSDPTTWISVILLVFTVAVLASFVPALRAARVEPMEALREE